MAEGEQGTNNAPPANTEQPEWAKNLQTSLGDVGKGINTLVKFAEQATQQFQAPPAAPVVEEEDGSDLLTSQDLEILPRRQFADRLMEAFQSNLEKALKPLEEGINRTAQTALVDKMASEAEKFAAKTPDFVEWGDEMMALAKAHPDLAISRIYAIAKTENPAKAAEMAKKYAKPDEKPGQPRKAPLSLSPASHSGEVKNQRMNAEDAARSAWEETVAKFGNPWSG